MPFVRRLHVVDYQLVANTYHFALQNGPFQDAKWSISRAETARFRSRNDTYWISVNIFQYPLAAFCPFRVIMMPEKVLSH